MIDDFKKTVKEFEKHSSKPRKLKDVAKWYSDKKAVEEELKKIREEPVADEELKNTKDATINQFVFKFTNPDQIVNIYIYIELLGLAPDYLETYREQVLNVTKEDIQRVAQKYIKADDLIYLVVGDEENFDAPLSEFGPVNRIQAEK